MIYGSIGVDYKSKLVCVENSIDSLQYKFNIIQSKMIVDMDKEKGHGNWLFMQDGARCHTSQSTVKWLATVCRFIKKWPANSPDLNPIDNFWGCLKCAVSKLKPKTVQELKQVVEQIWSEFDQESINNLVLSFFLIMVYVLTK